MLTKPLPDLPSWIRHLSQQEIPILAYSLERMHELQGKFDDIDIRDIAHLIRHDPLLSLRLVRYLESHRHNSQITDVTTLDRILLMIGLSGFFRAFGHSLVLENQLVHHPEALEGCRRVCSRAYFSARIAETIATRRHDLDPAELTTAVLLHNSAEILLWVEAPTLAIQIASLLKNNPGMRSRDAQKQVLGVTLHELHLGLLQAWHLPKLLQHLLDDRFANEPRVRTAAVATNLARHLGNSWYDPGLHDDYQSMANLIGSTAETAYTLTQNIALSTAKEWQWFGIPPAAAMLVQTAPELIE
ncbi:MAG: HDOD domain-containing protein [Formivibrio sp.]|nr:HDOD domain-containing protein [Formivibrio sp.]